MAALLVASSLLPARRAEALVINVVPGLSSSSFRQAFGVTAGPVSDAIFLGTVTAAADYWEGLLLDDRTLRIEVGWTTRLQAGALAAETDNGVSPVALIGFSPIFSWFFDPTPLDNSEYANEAILFDDLGGGPLNTAIAYSGGTGSAQDRFDVFSVALHEIGHALGLGGLFEAVHGDNPITIEDPLPFAGSVLPYTRGHLAAGPGDLPLSLMQPFGTESQRLLPSDADILAVAQAGGFDNVRLNDVTPVPVPEPATDILILSGIVVLFGPRRRRPR